MTRIAPILIAVTFGVASLAGQAKPQLQVPSISKRPNGASLGTIRAGAADNNIWFGWRVAMPSTAIAGLTFSDALAKVDILSVTSVELVREGGGIGGHHAVTYANNHWPEFAEMMGGCAGAHRAADAQDRRSAQPAYAALRNRGGDVPFDVGTRQRLR